MIRPLAFPIVQSVPVPKQPNGGVVLTSQVVGFTLVPFKNVAVVSRVEALEAVWKPPVAFLGAVGDSDPSFHVAVTEQCAYLSANLSFCLGFLFQQQNFFNWILKLELLKLTKNKILKLKC